MADLPTIPDLLATDKLLGIRGLRALSADERSVAVATLQTLLDVGALDDDESATVRTSIETCIARGDALGVTGQRALKRCSVAVNDCIAKWAAMTNG